MKKQYGFFSAKDYETIMELKPYVSFAPGVAVFSTPEGKEVIITSIKDEANPPPSSVGDDAVAQGEVVKFLRVATLADVQRLAPTDAPTLVPRSPYFQSMLEYETGYVAPRNPIVLLDDEDTLD